MEKYIKTIEVLASRVIWLEKGKILMDDMPKKVLDAYAKKQVAKEEKT